MSAIVWALWGVHNCAAHPLLTLSGGASWAVRFHDWTADVASAWEADRG